VLKGLGMVVDERIEEAVVESLGGSGEEGNIAMRR
jgi:hypothetical protein